jgi:hypothetical protein
MESANQILSSVYRLITLNNLSSEYFYLNQYSCKDGIYVIRHNNEHIEKRTPL